MKFVTILVNGDIVYAQTWETKEHHQATSSKCLEISLENLHVDTGLRGLKTVHTYFGGLRSLWMIALGLIPCKYSTPLAHCRAQLIT